MGKKKRDNQNKGIVYYIEWMKVLIEEYPPELRHQIDDAVKRYVLYGEKPEDPQIAFSMFSVMRSRIDEDSEKYNEICEKRREVALKRHNNEVDKEDANATSVTNATSEGKEKEIKRNEMKLGRNNISTHNRVDSENPPQGTPNYEEVEKFFSDNHIHGLDYFWEEYSENGWMSGGTPIKDWRKFALGWQKQNGYGINRRQSSSTPSNGVPFKGKIVPGCGLERDSDEPF